MCTLCFCADRRSIYSFLCINQQTICVLMFEFQCCDVRCDFHMNTMFGSYLPSVVCRREHVMFALFVFVCVQWCPTHIGFVFLRLVCPMLLVSLDCLLFCLPRRSVFSNVYMRHQVYAYIVQFLLLLPKCQPRFVFATIQCE